MKLISAIMFQCRDAVQSRQLVDHQHEAECHDILPTGSYRVPDRLYRSDFVTSQCSVI